MSWKLCSYLPSRRITEDSKTRLLKLLDLECWSKAFWKLEGDPTLEASIKEVATFSDLCTNQIDLSKAEDQGSSVATREGKEISSINNAAQASVPKVEDREGHNSTPLMHLGGWPTSLSQWIWTEPALLTEIGMGKAKDADNSALMQPLPDLHEEQPTMPVSNVDRQDISLETVHTATKDVLEQTSLISMMNSIPTKNWNLLIRLPKSATSLTQ